MKLRSLIVNPQGRLKKLTSQAAGPPPLCHGEYKDRSNLDSGHVGIACHCHFDEFTHRKTMERLLFSAIFGSLVAPPEDKVTIQAPRSDHLFERRLVK